MQSELLDLKSVFKVYFEKGGEEGFRRIESRVLAELGKRTGMILATGGGCVTQKENYQHLHQNSKIVWIQRALSLLPKDGRPLSKAGQLESMYEVRRPMYEAFADLAVLNDTTPEEAANRIEKAIFKEDHI